MRKGLVIITMLTLGTLLLSIVNTRPEQIPIPTIRIERIIPSQCSEFLDSDRLNNRIISKHKSNDSLYVKISFSENCCFNFQFDLFFEDNVLEINPAPHLEDTVIICECNCCYEMTLVFSGNIDQDFVINFKGKEIVLTDQYYKDIYPEEYEIYDGDTINKKNSYGHKVGPWYEYNHETKKRTSCIFYSGITGNDLMDFLGSEKYYPNGNLEQHIFIDSTLDYFKNNQRINFTERILYGCTTETFYDNGRLKSQCKPIWSNDSIKYIDSCTYWKKNGRIQK